MDIIIIQKWLLNDKSWNIEIALIVISSLIMY